MAHVDKNGNEGPTSRKVTSKVRSHLSGSVSPADLPRKKRVPGACDVCRRRKSGCNSAEMPDNKCSNCIQFGHECTHREVVKHSTPAKGYVEALEQKLEKMEKLLNKLLPGIDLNQDTDVPPMTLPRNDLDAIQHFSKLQINPPQNRFFGRSSTFHLIQTALDIKGEDLGSPGEITKRLLGPRRPIIWGGPSRFRTISLERPTPPPFTFPEPDLLKSLVDLYFGELSIFFPLLHRPTFESSVAEDLHLKDHEFGAVVLLVCALGAKLSDDPRVFSDISMLDGQGMSNEEKARALLASCGWKWYEQVDLMRANLAKRPTLYELQAYALSVLFCHSSEEPDGAWTQMGIAMRMAQDVGAHRKCTKHESKAQDELWRRAFWVIASHDRTASAFAGKPLCLHAEDIDVEFPTECDDEYWDHVDPKQRFKQPAGKPSTMAFFTCYLNLSDILAWAMRAIYSVSKPHLYRFATLASLGYSEQQSLSDLDSAMNSWMGALPEHLRWNPNEENSVFLAQSATLHAMYYQLQIFIHRPFIPSPRNSTPSIYPSLAICTNAARSCCHVLETQSKRDLQSYKLSLLAMPTFTAAVVLLLNIWNGKRSGVNVYPRRDYEDVQKCLDMLKRCEIRKPIAGRLWEILKVLSSVGDPGHEFSARSPVMKGPEPESRPQESSPASSDISPKPSPLQAAGSPNSFVSSSSSAPPEPPPAALPTATTSAQPQPNFMLPFFTNELGRLPLFGQFSFLDTPASNGLSQFVAGNNEGLSSSSSSWGSPSPPGFAAPTTPPPATATSLPVSSLPHPITAQLDHNTRTATSVKGFTIQDTQQDVRSFNDLFSYQAPTQVAPASNLTADALATAQLMAQFSDLANMNSPAASGVGIGTNPAFAGGGPSLGNLPNMNGGPSGGGQVVLEQSAQLLQGLLYDTNQMVMDEDMVTIWSTAPNGFELDDWGTYITSVDQIMRDQTMV
ncbi:hypothetical protein BDN72DRAFT_823317 [Pluteus cervinus]|uniref:Uncharacterized protein n=1 Tax=Pluteus cervinus TaxID=181527 RepID=A0ACD3AM27_9AGAR|nr:hypothetical protein BDN72DRAFT_823317 [Pluteus cervinus]